MMTTLLLMLVGHALADYPLQGDWLSKAKNQKLSVVPGETIWPGALACHSAIHAAFVGVITGSVLLAAFEFVAHTIIDWSKCQGLISYNVDQALHMFCKLCWFVILLAVLA